MFFYRTSSGMEVDFILKGKGVLIPIEVKAANRVSAVDGRSIEAFMSDHKKAAPFGIIVHRGREIGEVNKNIWAIPDWLLFA